MGEPKPEAADTAREPSQYCTAEEVNTSVGISTARHAQSAFRSCPEPVVGGGGGGVGVGPRNINNEGIPEFAKWGV